jgi:hypothetical protein
MTVQTHFFVANQDMNINVKETRVTTAGTKHKPLGPSIVLRRIGSGSCAVAVCLVAPLARDFTTTQKVTAAKAYR